MARHYGIPQNHRPGNRLERLRGSGQASSERTDQEQPAQGSHPKHSYKVMEALGWFAFMLMATAVYAVFA